MSLATFLKSDQPLALGSLVAPIVSLLIALYEKFRAEEMHPHLLNVGQSFTAVMLTGLALPASFAIAFCLAPRVKNPKPFPRLLVGLGTGLGTLTIASLIFTFFI